MDADALAARIQQSIGSPSIDGRVADRPAPIVPDHELVARIGGGSYGDVWLARSVTGQLRAVKVVWRRNFSSDRPYEREFRGIMQFEPISRSHPGVVNVLHVGRDDDAGCFFYVMELADDANTTAHTNDEQGPFLKSKGPGQKSAISVGAYTPRTLAANLKVQGRLPVSSVLALGVQLADALGHVHRHGLVHRDVKPSNVIFVDGQAKLADIGLIAGVDEARSFVGTEGFIPPEGPGSVQADLFGLGRLLYEAATGKDRCEFPDLPPDLDSWSDRALMVEFNEILSRACDPKPKQRHVNAAELAGDLNLLLSGRSIRRAYGMEHRLRHVTRIAFLAAIAAVLAGGGVWFQKAQRQRADARAQEEATLRQRAIRAEQHARDQLRESLLQQARAITSSSELNSRSRALGILQQAALLRPGLDLRNAALAALATPELRVVRDWNPRTTESTHERPDVTLRRYSRQNADGTLSVHSTENDVELVRLPRLHVRADYGIFSPDGAWLGVKYEDQQLRVWHLTTVTNFIVADGVRDFAFTADGRHITAGCSTAQLVLRNLKTGLESWRQTLPFAPHTVACHPVEPLVLIGAEGRTQVDVRRLEDGEVAQTFTLPPLGWIARWSADGGSLITAHRDFSIRVWDWPSEGSLRLVLRFHRSEPVFMSTDPSGRWLATAAWDNQSALFDLSDGRVLLSRAGTAVYAAADRPSFLLVNDAEWSLVEFESAFALESIRIHDEHKSPRDLAFSPDGRWLATGGQDGIRVLDRHTRTVHRLMNNEMSHRLAFTADSGRLFSITPDRLAAWRFESDPETGLRTEPCEIPAKGLRGFSNTDYALIGMGPNGERWLSAALDPESRSWRWISGRFDSTTFEFIGAVTPRSHGPVISADGRWIAWGTWRGNDAHVLAVGTDAPVVRLTTTGSTSVTFSPDNRLLAIGCSDSIRFHEVGSWQVLHSIPRQPTGQLPPSIAFAPDSNWCAVVLPPNRVLLLDSHSGEELASLPVRFHLPVKSAFSPDRRFLAAVSTDHHLLIWDLEKLGAKLAELGLNW
jgi:serine/threonine protein kinase/WD40 repeat protein